MIINGLNDQPIKYTDQLIPPFVFEKNKNTTVEVELQRDSFIIQPDIKCR